MPNLQWTPLLVYRSAAVLGSLVLAFDGFVVAGERGLPGYAHNLLLAAIIAPMVLCIGTYIHAVIRAYVHFLMLIVVAIVLTYSISVAHATQLDVNDVLGSILLLCGSLIVYHRVWLITVNMLIGFTIFTIGGLLVENPLVSFDKFIVSSVAFALLFYVLIVANLRIREKGNESEVAANAWFDNSADGLIYGDLKARTAHRMNPAMVKLFACEDPMLVAEAILDGIQSGRSEAESDELLARGARTEKYEATFKFAKITGNEFWGALTLRQINLSGEQSTLVRITDVSARVNYENALREAKAEAEASALSRTRFLANMSHEIRTPMNGVIGMTSLLLDSDLDEQQRACMETIRSSGESLLTIINDILDFSKVDADQIELEQQLFDPEVCAAEALEVVAPAAAEKNLCLTMTADTLPLTPCTGDVTRVRQVLVNLLSNAVKFTDSGSVNVHLTQFDSTLSFRVTDTGMGIPSAKLSTLFDAFTQADASTTRRFGGTGLGLSISKRLANLMDGDIHVESSPGEGSTFTLTVEAPAAASDKPAVQVTEATALVFDTTAAMASTAQNLRLVCREVTCANTLDVLAEAGGNQRYDYVFIATSSACPDAREAVAAAAQPGAQHVLMTQLGAYAEHSNDFDYQLRAPLRPSELCGVVCPELSKEAETHHTFDMPALPAAGRSFLLAEDNPVNQKVALMMLAKLGLQADAVSNGREAIEILQKRHYDCVLLDLQMPEIDGLEACHLIRQDEALRQPYIIAMTANAMSEDRAACSAAGMDNFLAKPVRMRDMHQVLGQALASIARR